jgi:uncharacterized protein YuzE
MKGKRNLVMGLVGILVLGLNLSLKAEDVYEAWVARYDGPGHLSDWPQAMVVDGIGNVYVTGFTNGQETGADYTTIKYSPQGETLWVRSYNSEGNESDGAFDVARDYSGNIYVTGLPTTIKYSSDGDVVWSTGVSGRRIKIEGSKSYIITYDYSNRIIKLDSLGDTIFAVHDAAFLDLTPGKATSYFCAAGYTRGWDDGEDYAVVWYSSSGSMIRMETYDGVYGRYGDDKATGIAIDEAENVLVTGSSGDSIIFSDIATIKYDYYGNPLWVKRYDGTMEKDDEPTGIAVDKVGNSYIIGTTNKQFPHESTDDIVVLRYSANGDTSWSRIYNGPLGGVDWGISLAVDTQGYVYATGHSAGVGTLQDFVTIKYSPQGDVQWIKRYDGPIHNDEYVEDIEIDLDGNVYITGFSIWSASASYKDYLTIKYSPCLPSSPKAGDANSDDSLTLADVVTMVNHIFGRGPRPYPPCDDNLYDCWVYNRFCRYDWNGDQKVTLGDCIRAINYIFNKPGIWNPVPSLGCCPFPQNQ